MLRGFGAAPGPSDAGVVAVERPRTRAVRHRATLPGGRAFTAEKGKIQTVLVREVADCYFPSTSQLRRICVCS